MENENESEGENVKEKVFFFKDIHCVYMWM